MIFIKVFQLGEIYFLQNENETEIEEIISELNDSKKYNDNTLYI
jgi:hypothetical protein